MQNNATTQMIAQQKPELSWTDRLMYVLKRDWQLYVFIALPLAYLLIFKFYPMLGQQIAFRDFTAKGGIWNSDWVGLSQFVRFLKNPRAMQFVTNTVAISVYGLIVNNIVPIAFALTLNCVELPRFKKISQTIVTLPHFISIVVLVGLMMQLFDSRTGLYGAIYYNLTGQIPEDLFSKLGTFRHMFVWSGAWQNFGWSAIIYIASLSGVDAGLHDAAQLDGASRFQRMLHVDLPHILPTVIILTIMDFGGILSVGFEKVFLMQNPLNLEHSQLISTYVYEVGLNSSPTDFSYATAIGTFTAAINLVLMSIANRASKLVSETSLW